MSKFSVLMPDEESSLSTSVESDFAFSSIVQKA